MTVKNLGNYLTSFKLIKNHVLCDGSKFGNYVTSLKLVKNLVLCIVSQTLAPYAFKMICIHLWNYKSIKLKKVRNHKFLHFIYLFSTNWGTKLCLEKNLFKSIPSSEHIPVENQSKEVGVLIEHTNKHRLKLYINRWYVIHLFTEIIYLTTGTGIK